jgi:hypothetical protein
MLKKTITAALLCLLALVQGITLTWVHCCCGESGFKPCSCSDDSSTDATNSQSYAIAQADDCACVLHIVKAQQPIPVPQAFDFKHDPPRVASSPVELAAPLLPETAVLHTRLTTSPPEVQSCLLDQPFLCIFRC